jgi:hypothetical protein
VTRARLSDLEPLMNAQCRDALAHPIEYKPVNRPWKTLYVQGNYEDGNISTGFSAAIEQQIELMAVKTDLATRPASGDRLRLPRVPGKLFQPVNVQNDDTGDHWLFNVKQVAA